MNLVMHFNLPSLFSENDDLQALMAPSLEQEIVMGVKHMPLDKSLS